MDKTTRKLNIVLSALLFLGMGSAAHAEDLVCTIKESTQVVATKKVRLPAFGKVAFFELRGFRFHLSHLSGSQFEIEVFDPHLPGRSYAQGRLLDARDLVKWSLWTRYAMLESSCRLALGARSRR